MGAKRLGYGGETTRVENRSETTWGKRLGGECLGGETSCYLKFSLDLLVTGSLILPIII